jgi:hypothetical protein
MRGKTVPNQEFAVIPCIPDSLIRSLLCFRAIIIIIIIIIIGGGGGGGERVHKSRSPTRLDEYILCGST